MRIHIVNDDSLNVSKEAYRGSHIYKPLYAQPCMLTGRHVEAREEKKARGALLSAVERLLSKDDIVIADGMNYIKGFRYQLYCVARAIGTPHCVVSGWIRRGKRGIVLITRDRFIVEHLWQWPKNGTRLEEKLVMTSKCMYISLEYKWIYMLTTS